MTLNTEPTHPSGAWIANSMSSSGAPEGNTLHAVGNRIRPLPHLSIIAAHQSIIPGCTEPMSTPPQHTRWTSIHTSAVLVVAPSKGINSSCNSHCSYQNDICSRPYKGNGHCNSTFAAEYPFQNYLVSSPNILDTSDSIKKSDHSSLHPIIIQGNRTE